MSGRETQRATPAELERARKLAARCFDGNELEVDDDAIVSPCAEDAGAWVQAWLWVPDPEVKEEDQ